ncbi:OB-fold domain-containing protein [Candidatus Woesebacteria bacterium]|nr:OB-fold domain-containing protein [Candidatus Woesebacteria bacterium]
MTNTIADWRRQKTDRHLLHKHGTIVSWTEIHVAPPQFSGHTPYCVALVKLNKGPTICCQVVNTDEKTLSIGAKVKTLLRRLHTVGEEEVISYGVACALI